ncbi:MAG: hypothetical protein ACE5HS_20270 [bacterium]
MDIVLSKSNVPIRITEERWQHIITRHPEMSGVREKLIETIHDPELILEGDKGTVMAVRFYKETKISSKYLIVIYKEIVKRDGFVLTAYFANQYARWRKVLWKK